MSPSSVVTHIYIYMCVVGSLVTTLLIYCRISSERILKIGRQLEKLLEAFYCVSSRSFCTTLYITYTQYIQYVHLQQISKHIVNRKQLDVMNTVKISNPFT